ncbi:protoporphyrinogen oxidase [Thalassiella azotivora]
MSEQQGSSPEGPAGPRPDGPAAGDPGLETGQGERRGRTVVVVGAGVTGLATAWRLHRSDPDCRVVVLEQADRVGGALLRGQVDPDLGLVADLGAEALLARRPEAVDLVREVGLGDDLVHPATSRAAIWSRGRLHPMPSGTHMGVPGDPQALRGLLTDEEVARAAAEPALPAVPVTGGDVDVASFVAARVGPAVVERLVEPLLGGVYAGHASRLSLRATVPVLWPAALHGSSLLDTVRQHTQGAGTAAGAGAGAPVFAGIRGGVARLVEGLRDRLAEGGVEVRTRACVQRLQRSGDRWRLELGPAGRGPVLQADAVVLTVPAPRAARLLADAVPAAAAELGEVRTASMAVGTFVLPASVLDGLDVSGFLVPPVEGRLVKAATFSTRKWDWLRQDAGGRAVVRVSVGRADEEEQLQRPDAELLDAAAADLGEMLRRPVPYRSAVLTRWGGALPQYDVGHVDRVERARAAVAAHGGLAVAGASYDGVGVPACVAGADAAARTVLAALG